MHNNEHTSDHEIISRAHTHFLNPYHPCYGYGPLAAGAVVFKCVCCRRAGDLFDMLLPMLSIYQEYVRNHHYSLQVLAECKQNSHFAAFLNRLESRPTLQGRTLETFLTYPMHQIPRYIITLHELLAHTPHNHVERKSLDHARMQLEDLSRQMHDEVSETENIRKNLAIERMIVEGCDILLDVNQMFVRQGKKPYSSNTLSSCFPKDSVPSFPRRSIDFPRKTTDLFTSEDGEEVGATPRSQRSHSTVSYLSREQQLAAIGSRRRLSSLRQSSLGNTASGVAGLLGVASSAVASASPASLISVGAAQGGAGASIVKQTLTLGSIIPVSPPFSSANLETRRLSDAPRIRKKSVRISDDSFDECEEMVASGSVTAATATSVFTPEATPSPEQKAEDDSQWRPSNLASVAERTSVDSGSSEGHAKTPLS